MFRNKDFTRLQSKKVISMNLLLNALHNLGI